MTTVGATSGSVGTSQRKSAVDQSDERRSSSNGVRQKCHRDVAPGKSFAHDPGADDRREQETCPHYLSGQPPSD
jgi:hypothetical protein